MVDSGVTVVPDLKGKIAETFWDKTIHNSAADVLGHGTFVSSIIAARNDDGFGMAGFCGACRLAVYKAVPVNDVQVAEGIRTLTDAHVRIINLSIVLDSPSSRSPTRSRTPPQPACWLWRGRETRARRRRVPACSSSRAAERCRPEAARRRGRAWAERR